MSPKGRPSTGHKYRGPSGQYFARITHTVDGERVRSRVSLGTSNETVAALKLKKLLADPSTIASVKKIEVFEVAAERVYEMRLAEGVVAVESEIGRLRNYANPVIGRTPVDKVTPADINAILDRAKGEGLARQTVAHVRAAVRLVYEALRREGAVTANPVEGAAMPRFRAAVTKERQVLSDDELLVYLGWQHPQESRRLPVLRRQTMSCVARCFGGLRTGDLHALTWASFEADFSVGWAPRKKTKRPQRIEVPEGLRPILRDWWERLGRPESGPMFPVLRGARAGEAKTVGSHAKLFRRDLMRAFGLERWDPLKSRWVQGREMTARDVELFTETDQTLPVDFHSWRRAFTQALADVGMSAQQATALSGHASFSAHARYLASAGKVRQIPDAALPRLSASSRTKVGLAKTVSIENDCAPERNRTSDPRLRRPSRKLSEPANPAGITPPALEASNAETPCVADAGLKSWTKTNGAAAVVSAPAGHAAAPAAPADHLEIAVRLAAEAGEWEVVAKLSAELSARRAAASAPPAGVSSLDAARAKRGDR